MTIKVSYNITTPTIRITYNNSSVFVKATSQSSSVYVKTSYGTGGGGAAVWGGITGTLSDQTDLQSALDGKYDDPTGTTAQYIRGDGSLATFPTIPDVSGFVPKTTNLTINGTTQDLSTDRTWNVGDMLKSVYDTDDNGIVDKAEKMTTICRNSTGATIYKGTIVYLSGSTGNRPNIVKAIATSDATSAQTFGVVIDDIANNSDGEVATLGTLDNLDTRSSATHPFTSDTLADGDILYLSPTTAGYVTNVKPFAPYHIVYCGMVVRTHPTLGTIVYRIQNGYELDELHNVSAQTPSNNDGLFYEASTSLWKNKSIATVLGYTPVPSTRTLTINGTGYDLSADRSWTISSLPSQTGNAGKYLTTDGTNASWASVSGTNIYTTDGTLTGNRTVTANGNSLTILGGVETFTGYQRALWLKTSTNAKNSVELILDNTYTTTGKMYEIASYSDGTFNITDRTTANLKFKIAGTYTLFNSAATNGNILGLKNSINALWFNIAEGNTSTSNYTLCDASGITILNASSDILFRKQNAERGQIFSATGNWLIQTGGTMADAGYKLDVQGTGRFTGAVYTGNTSNVGIWVADNTSIRGTATTGGNLYIDANSVIDNTGTINLRGKVTTSNTLSVQSTLTVGGNIFVPNNGALRVNQASNGSLFLDASIDFTGNVFARTTSFVVEYSGSIPTTYASALFAVTSTTKGFLPPRLTTAQMYAISSPANGLEVYKTDGYQGKYVYMENEWVPVADGNELIAYTGNQGTNAILAPMTARVAGTGAIANQGNFYLSGLKIHGVNFATGTTSTGYGGIYTALNAGMSIGGKVCWRFILTTPSVLSNATDTYYIQVGNGVLPNTTPNGNEICFYYSHGTNGGNWTCYYSALGTYAADSGVAVAVSTVYVLEIEYIASTSIKWYINGVLVNTKSATVPASINGAYLAGSTLTKTAGTTSITMYQGSILARKLI